MGLKDLKLFPMEQSSVTKIQGRPNTHQFRPRVRFGLWLVVGGELVHGLWGFWGWCQLGGGVVRSWRGAASFLCWWAAVSHRPGVGELVRRHVPCRTFD